MQLSTLVLPAPLGPIRASSSPARASNDTSCRTCRPPNASDTPLSASAASAIPAAAAAVLLHVAVAAAPLAAACPEIELAHVLVRAQPLRRAVEHDAAVLDHVGVVGEIERHVRVLLDDQQRGAEPLADAAQRAAQLLDGERGEAERKLVD